MLAVVALPSALDRGDGEVGRVCGGGQELDEAVGGEAEEGGVGLDNGFGEIIGEAEVAAEEVDVLEAEAAARGREEEELAEADDGRRTEGGGDSLGLGTERRGGARGEAGVEHAVDGVEEEVEGVRVAQEEAAGVEGREAELAAREGAEAGEGDGHSAASAAAGGRGRGGGVEEEGVEGVEAADALLDLHDAVEGVVADALLLLRDGGGLGGIGGRPRLHRSGRTRRWRRPEGRDAAEHGDGGFTWEGFCTWGEWVRP